MERFFDDKIKPYPVYQVFDENLKRWVKKQGVELLNGISISVKTFRKTWECWLVCSYPERIPLIAMSQGHTEIVAMNHYLNIPFSKEEIDAIKEKTAGWLMGEHPLFWQRSQVRKMDNVDNRLGI